MHGLKNLSILVYHVLCLSVKLCSGPGIFEIVCPQLEQFVMRISVGCYGAIIGFDNLPFIIHQEDDIVRILDQVLIMLCERLTFELPFVLLTIELRALSPPESANAHTCSNYQDADKDPHEPRTFTNGPINLLDINFGNKKPWGIGDAAHCCKNWDKAIVNTLDDPFLSTDG